MKRNLRLSILYDDWWVVNETRDLLRIIVKTFAKYHYSFTVAGPVPLRCGLLVSCQLHPLVPHHPRQRDHNPDQGTVIIRGWESWHIIEMGISRWFAFSSFWSPSLDISVCFVVEVEEGPLTVIIWYLQWFDCERMIIKWCRAGSCICHDYKASAGQSGVGSQDRRLVRLPGAGGGMQNSSISSSRTQHHSGDRWWDSALCGSLRVDESFQLDFYQLQAVAIMVTITVCKSNMVSGR